MYDSQIHLKTISVNKQCFIRYPSQGNDCFNQNLVDGQTDRRVYIQMGNVKTIYSHKHSLQGGKTCIKK